MAVNTELTVEKFNELEQYIDSMPSTKGELIRVLHKAQGIFGFLPEEVQKFIAKKLDLSTAKVFGVVSFYSYFTMEPKGDNPIAICMGTACYVRGAEKVQDAFMKELGIKVGETTADGKFSLDALRCVGACGLAPVVLVGEKVYGRVTVEDVKKIISNY
ncbi:NADP-reducing hydrogenase subunit HndA [Petrocella atlantisensis]|uniref:NADP-reducing hydrogenase subunit HndA n=1 Tax=Petrocella atlantisensis TaxID=2173034 RepID=A0A3P7RVU0_9FIRM|nr:NAD(P)H-dependent oxidoreductase subunit E [Petrocella atlantisensis]VDN46896.1 NADP-reducing hydrogenase subunit HndA [Petrocella atlantisensis]